MDLGNVGAHDARMTQSDSDTSNDMSYDDVCAIAWKGYRAGNGTGKKGPNGSVTWRRGNGADEWVIGRRDDGGKKGGKQGSKGSKLDWYGDKGKGSTGNKGKGKGKSEARCCYDCFPQGHTGVNCPTKKRTKARRGKVSLTEKRQKNSRAWRHLMTRESGAGPKGTESQDGESEWTQDQHFTALLKITWMSKCLED